MLQRISQVATAAALLLAVCASSAVAQSGYNDAYRPPAQRYAAPDPYAAQGDRGYQRDQREAEEPDYKDERGAPRRDSDAYQPPRRDYGDAYEPPRGGGAGERYYDPPQRGDYDRSDRYGRDDRGRYAEEDLDRGTYSENEVLDAGHRFFGSVSRGLAEAVQSLFRSSGRPNGYILGEDAGGAFVAGLRYGEGTLFTKGYGRSKVYWQGPSLGYDFGGEGSKVMVLVYNLRHPDEIYRRFGGVQGSAYLIGGVSVQLQKADDITLAPIRSGVGVRLGANVGYLKYTRRPTWNPF